MTLKLRKGDTVKVLSGSNSGKTGLIDLVMPDAMKAVVQGLNKVKRHVRKSTKFPAGGIIAKEAPVHLSSLMLVCPHCKKPTRLSIKRVEGKRYRLCQKCGKTIDEKVKNKG